MVAIGDSARDEVKNDCIAEPRDDEDQIKEDESTPFVIGTNPTPESGITIGVIEEEIGGHTQRESESESENNFNLLIQLVRVLFQNDPVIEQIGNGRVPEDIAHAAKLNHESLREWRE